MYLIEKKYNNNLSRINIFINIFIEVIILKLLYSILTIIINQQSIFIWNKINILNM